MINGMSNTRGSGKRRAVVLLLLAVFCVAIFAPTVTATQWAPDKVFPERDQVIVRPEMDDIGWVDGQTKSSSPSKNKFGCFDIRYTAPTLFLWFLELMDSSVTPDQGNGNDRQSLDHDRTTAPQ